MSALSASTVEELQDILKDLNEEMFEDTTTTGYENLCDGINFDIELSEGENEEKCESAPILLPFTSYTVKEKEIETPSSSELINDQEGCGITDEDYMDDSVFNTLFDGVDMDEISFQDIQHLLQENEIKNLQNRDDKNDVEHRLMSKEEMDNFIEKLFTSDSGEMKSMTESPSINSEVSFFLLLKGKNFTTTIAI